MAGTRAVSTGVAWCGACKCPSAETSWSLCASCLNRNLQRACQKTIVLPSRALGVGPGERRTFFPGMPRAVLGPLSQVPVGSSEPVPREATTLLSRVKVAHRVQEADASALSGAPKVQRARLVKSLEVNGAGVRISMCGEEQKLRESKDKESSVEGEGKRECVVADNARLFQIRKNLTVKIPNPPCELTKKKPGRPQSMAGPPGKYVNPLPARTDALLRNSERPCKFKRWTTRPDANAEAELMMRLLADSLPVLKPSGPVSLSVKARPAPISPLSPPGDPLWKRRCIPCPQSLKLKATTVCVR